ncbi:MAG: site-2 protease family protein [Coriobacteriia bacterium]|nr:site-2 protease family protein [Coriobacteriia bacterium]
MSEWMFGILELAMFIPAIVLHEVSHGYVSYRLGDPTAKMKGRLSLNPIKHMDLFGTVLLPLMLWASGAPVFGYAKPVPINPGYYKDYRKGMMLTGLAGPTTNLTLAVVSGLLVRMLLPLGDLATGTTADATFTVLGWVVYALYFFSQINLVLMFFNLIPIPPLDGSRVLPLFLSDKALMKYHQVERYGILIFFGLLLLVPRIVGFSPIGVYFDYTVYPLLSLFTGIG